MTPDGRYLYVANAGNYVNAFQVSPTGVLTLLGPTPGYPVTNSPNGIAIDPSGQHLYVTQQTGNSLAVFTINSANGTLTPVTCSFCSLTAGSKPENVVVDPTGSYIYVTLPFTGQVAVGTIQKTGANAGTLSAISMAYTNAAVMPWDLALSPGGNTLYVTDPANDRVLAFAASGGALGAPTLTSVGGSAAPAGIAIDPSGKYVYTANNGTNTVTALSVSGTTVSVLGSLAAAAGPWGVTVDPTGHYVYVAGQSAGAVSAYSIGGTGALTFLNNTPTGSSPTYLLAHNAPLPVVTPAVPAASTWSLAALGILLAGFSGLIYRKAYR
jgi:DNA-binding beta-propeller fold protein YncE